MWLPASSNPCRQVHMSDRVRSYKDLRVWQRSMDLMVSCYRLTKQFPREERYGLSSQLQRASLSVPANIAEGNGRRHRKEYLHHLSIAKGSLNEVETLLLAAARLGYLKGGSEPLLEMVDEASRRLVALMRALDKGDPDSRFPRPIP